MKTVTVDLIRVLAAGIDETAPLYFSRHKDRLYVGRRPASGVKGSDATPVNHVLADRSPESIQAVVDGLNG